MKSILSFETLFDLDQIQKIQDSFARATGVASIITAPDGRPITNPSNFCNLCKNIIRKTEKGRSNCIQSDAVIGQSNPDGPVIQACLSGGLWDAGVSIHVAGKHIANWLIGQVRNEKTDINKIMEYAKIIGADQNEFIKALNEVTVMPLDQFKEISQYLFLIANQLSEQAYQRVKQDEISSNLKESEDRLKAKTKNLQQTMDLLTAEIDKRIHLENERKKMAIRLRQSQKMEAIGTLSGGIAHDFNNILFPVIGFSEMILEDLPENSPVKKQMQAVLDGALRARDLVRQIMTFSRQTEQDCRPLKIQLLLKEVLNFAKASLPSTIKIRANIPKDIGMVMADPSQIHQMVMNLITNAAHSMEETGGELSVTLSEVDVVTDGLPFSEIDPGSYICLEITDTGSGMDQATLKRIFDPYFTTKPKEKGTGLGLAVVHGIIKNLHGEVVVQSQIGKGSAFLVYLPRIINQKPADDMKKISLAEFYGKERILLIDDEKSVLTMLEQVLSRFGYKVTCQDNGLNALKLFLDSPGQFDLVITDMTMPDITGDKILNDVKKNCPDIPVIICTGFSEKIANGGISGSTPDKILMKPVSRDDLLKSIRQVLGKRHPQQRSDDVQ